VSPHAGRASRRRPAAADAANRRENLSMCAP
jgi:hypothetical protein